MRKGGVICAALVVFTFLVLYSAQGFTNIESWNNTNASINFSYTGLDDNLLDHTLNVDFEVNYTYINGTPIGDDVGDCYLNFSVPSQVISMTYVTNGTFNHSITYTGPVEDRTFQVFCNYTDENDYGITLSNESGPINYQYDVYEPLIVDV